MQGDAGGVGSIPGLGRTPGEGSGNPLQYSCLENSMDRGAWWAIVYVVSKKSDMTATKQQQQNLIYTYSTLSLTHTQV